jgi:hypothetical protein
VLGRDYELGYTRLHLLSLPGSKQTLTGIQILPYLKALHQDAPEPESKDGFALESLMDWRNQSIHSVQSAHSGGFPDVSGACLCISQSNSLLGS